MCIVYKLKIAFYANASPMLGYGHIMRQLALMEHIIEEGYEVKLYSMVLCLDVKNKLDTLGVDVVFLNEETFPQCIEKVSVLVLDDYNLTEAQLAVLRLRANTLILFDDNTYSAPLKLDLVVNPSDVFSSIHHATVKLQGVKYRLIREEFTRHTLSSLPIEGSVLICLGGTDVRMLTPALCHSLLQKDVVTHVHVLTSSSISEDSLAKLKSLQDQSRLTLHINSDDIATLMKTTDIAITGAGGCLYELLYLGVPSIAVVLAENQKQAFDSKLNNAAYIAVDMRSGIANIEDVINKALFLLLSVDKKQSVAKNAQQQLDGYAAERIFDAIKQLRSD